MNSQISIDLTYGKNALFVRQTVAVAFGVPLGQEFTWDVLGDIICRRKTIDLPGRVSVEGLSSLAVQVPSEARMFRNFLTRLRSEHPSIEVMIQLH